MGKCDVCKKKITLAEETIGRCRCGIVGCGKHRLDHECKFRYEKDIKLEKITAKKVALI